HLVLGHGRRHALAERVVLLDTARHGGERLRGLPGEGDVGPQVRRRRDGRVRVEAGTGDGEGGLDRRADGAGRVGQVAPGTSGVAAGTAPPAESITSTDAPVPHQRQVTTSTRWSSTVSSSTRSSPPTVKWW